jgi:Rha family phage regulatory protein
MGNLTIVQNGQAVTSSRTVGQVFGKRNVEVMDSIRLIKEQISTVEFSTLFFESEYVALNGKKNPEYIMNRDGFTLLAMGFTGQDAMQWKIKYIQAFNEMEKQLSKPQSKIIDLDAKNKNADARLKNAQTRQAKFILDHSERFKGLLGKESMSLLVINAFEMITGTNTLPRPKLAENKYYTATEIGDIAGISANRIGILANGNDVKTTEYGHMVLDKSPHSVKQVETFRYNEAGKNKLLELIDRSLNFNR